MKQVRYLITTALILIACTSFATEKKKHSLEERSRGLPTIAKKHLNADSFEEVTAKKLANPQMLIVNSEALRQMGIEVPPEGATPEFVQKLLSEWAYAVPSKYDNASAFTPETKTYYADKYGGTGIGYNRGSARSMAAGDFQSKAGGITPLIEQPGDRPDNLLKPKTWIGKLQERWDDYHHSTGKMPISEAMQEYTWAETLNRELPYGANRVVAVIATGTNIKWAPGVGEPAAIVIRQNSIRPAHFIRNDVAIGRDEYTENDRLYRLVSELENSLPTPKDYKPGPTAGKRIADKFNEFVDRIGTQFGTEYGMSMYHGSTSPSNVDISGKALDHFPMTAMYGFPKLMNADISPSGDTKSLREEMVYQLVDDLRGTLPGVLQKSLPSHAVIARNLNKAYYSSAKKSLLWNLGTPTDLMEKTAGAKPGLDLSTTLMKIARAGNDAKIPGRAGVPTHNTGTYDFYDVVHRLTESGNLRDDIADADIAHALPDPALRAEAIKRFRAYYNYTAKQAVQEGINPEHLGTYFAEAARLRARPFYRLMRTKANVARLYGVTLKYAATKDPSVVSNYVDNVLVDTSRRHPGELPFNLVLDEKHDFDTGNIARRAYDMRSGKNIFVFQSPIVDGKANFFGKNIPVESLSKSTLKIETGSFLNKKSYTAMLASHPRKSDEYASFVVPEENGVKIDLNRFKAHLSTPVADYSMESKKDKFIPMRDTYPSCGGLTLLNLF